MPSTDDMLRLKQVLRGISKSKDGNANLQPYLPITPETLLRIKTTWEQEGVDENKTMLWAVFTMNLCGTESPLDLKGDIMPQDIEHRESPTLSTSPKTLTLTVKTSEHMISSVQCQLS